MKLNKTFLAGMLALTVVGSASAQSKVYITGSTAFRGAALKAIGNILDAGYTFGYVGASASGANQSIYNGSVGGTAVIIKTSWSGSEGGIQTVSNNQNVIFLPDNAGASAAGTPNDTDPTVSGNPNDTTIPDIAFSDTYQSTSQFNGLYKGQTYQALNEAANSPVGIVPFKFVASKGAPAGLTNVTSQLARTLFATGRMSLALFTGNPADEGRFDGTTTPNCNLVYATGRDPDSGTRLTAFAETGVGATQSVKQYQPTDGSSAQIKTVGGAVASNIPFPSGTVNGISVSIFNNGYNSGGNLSKAMANTTAAMTTNISGVTATGGYYVTYLGTGDANSNALPNGAVELAYNGVTLGGTSATNYNTVTALTEGAYTFWGYEHVLYRPSTVGTTQQTVADTLAAQIHNVDATVLLSSMKVSRTTDGARVAQSTY